VNNHHLLKDLAYLSNLYKLFAENKVIWLTVNNINFNINY